MKLQVGMIRGDFKLAVYINKYGLLIRKLFASVCRMPMTKNDWPFTDMKLNFENKSKNSTEQIGNVHQAPAPVYFDMPAECRKLFTYTLTIIRQSDVVTYQCLRMEKLAPFIEKHAKSKTLLAGVNV